MEFAEIPEYSQLKECHGNLAKDPNLREGSKGVKQSEKKVQVDTKARR